MSQPALPPVLVRGELRLDPARRQATRAGTELALSPKEFAVLEMLLGAQGAVVSTEELLERAWDEAADPFTQTVKVTVSRLRRKLGEPRVIETVDAGGVPDPVKVPSRALPLRTIAGGPAGSGLRGPRSIRWRLTLLYSALFAVAGAALLAFTYVLVATTAPSLVAGSPAPPSLDSTDVPAGPDGSRQDPAQVAAYVEGRLSVLRAEQLHQFLVESAVALAVMTVVSVALGWLMAGRVLAPLRTMTAAARRISADNLHERLSVPGPDDELKAMADTFDAVLGRVEGAFEAQKRFVANASHELRTPLTLQQAIVDVALADPDGLRGELCVPRVCGCGPRGRSRSG